MATDAGVPGGEQFEALEMAGSQAILMATRALPAIGARPETYHRIYRQLIDQAAAEKKLFSELGADWACPGTPVDMTDYREFVDPQAVAAAGDAAAVPPSGI